MSKPKFCPNCGVALLNEDFYCKKFSEYETKGMSGTTITIQLNGWSCDCESCGWEGDILPYDEDPAYRE